VPCYQIRTLWQLNQETGAGEHTRLGCRWTRLASSRFTPHVLQDLRNCLMRSRFPARTRKIARGARAFPISTPVFGLKSTCAHQPGTAGSPRFAASVNDGAHGVTRPASPRKRTMRQCHGDLLHLRGSLPAARASQTVGKVFAQQWRGRPAGAFLKPRFLKHTGETPVPLASAPIHLFGIQTLMSECNWTAWRPLKRKSFEVGDQARLLSCRMTSGKLLSPRRIKLSGGPS
jgi:hypothetical protein